MPTASLYALEPDVTTDVELLEVERPSPRYNLVSRNRMVAEVLPRAGGLAISAPDDIIALQYCIGAAMAGYKANGERLLVAVNGLPGRAACDATRM